MKRFTFLTIFLCFNLIFFPNYSFSQKIIESENEKFNEVIREKIRFDIEKQFEEIITLQDKEKQFTSKIQHPITNSADALESLVSSDTGAESELTAAINPLDSNNIIVSVMKQSTSALTILIYYTKDFGKTWTKSTFAPLPPRSDLYIIGGGDPVCAFDKDGIAHLTWISLTFKLKGSQIDTIGTAMHYGYSTNGGANWVYDYYNSVSHTEAYSPGAFNISRLSFFDDKQWLAADLNPTSPYYNNIYISLSRFIMSQSSGAKIIGFTKEDGNFFFRENEVSISNEPSSQLNAHQFSANSIAANGRIIVTYYASNNNKNYIYANYSDDGGKTYSSNPTLISEFKFVNSRLISSNTKDTIIGVDFSRVYPSIYNASDNNPESKYYGNSYVVWSAYGTTSVSKTGFNVYMAVSTDKGNTWSEPFELSKEPQTGDQDQFYPAITVNPNGTVIASWYEQGVNNVKSLTNYVTAFSFDGGLTFTKPIPANQIPTDFSTIGYKNNKFGIGEYNQVISTSSYAIPVWCDGRTGSGDLNVYAAFIPLNDETSVERIVNFGDNSFNLNIFPNPTTDKINIQLQNSSESNSTNIRISNLKGECLLESNTLNKELEIECTNLTSGVYYLEAENNGKRAIQKFIIKK
ncbi:MAG: hypothetical protein A2X64_07385 [Ignavibacteria bacterium GWF2_33_9]|nr:MAG: hypothetical protein A2X64_07385 [Ignavibacteria bacterium GWF2_33_9]